MSENEVTRRAFVQRTAATAAGLSATAAANAQAEPATAATTDVTQTRSYNENMEYRRLGKTELMISVISLGGHWKKIPYPHGTDDFYKNRVEVVAACLDHGVNFVDACTQQEVAAYPKALGKRREEMYIGYSYDRHEVRFKNWAESAKKLQEGFAAGLKEVGLEYVDLWRVMFHEQTGKRNTQKEIDKRHGGPRLGEKRGACPTYGLFEPRPQVDHQGSRRVSAGRSRRHALHTAFSKKKPQGQHVRGAQEARCRIRGHQALRQRFGLQVAWKARLGDQGRGRRPGTHGPALHPQLRRVHGGDSRADHGRSG